MNIEKFIKNVQNLGIEDFIGVPDSTLKSFCDYLNLHVSNEHHFVPVNEGACVALAAGLYLGDKKTSCVYMQNSGIGNAINPIASLINEKVYDIPMLFIIGYRGEPGIKDEPQHKFQGEITEPLMKCLEIPHACISKESTEEEMNVILKQAKSQLEANKQYAIIVKKDTFDKAEAFHFENPYPYNREEAIKDILTFTNEEDIVVSTTGKISREVYEQCDALFGNHERAFLTVGSMGHASMIALGIAMKNTERKVYCLDGDGAALMHMGSMAFLANQPCTNLIHVTLNNEAHESVGGMPTNCQHVSFAKIAQACGYKSASSVTNLDELTNTLSKCVNVDGPHYIEVQVALGARGDLGRPKETAVENKINFMNHITKWRD
ncbi:phosphonopyruvate decarboxylase [Amedibacillus sp. YH-ame6]